MKRNKRRLCRVMLLALSWEHQIYVKQFNWKYFLLNVKLWHIYYLFRIFLSYHYFNILIVQRLKNEVHNKNRMIRTVHIVAIVLKHPFWNNAHVSIIFRWESITIKVVQFVKIWKVQFLSCKLHSSFKVVDKQRIEMKVK